MAKAVLLLLAFVCCALGHVHTGEEAKTFGPDVPRVYLTNINGATVAPLATQPRVQSTNALDIAQDIVEQLVGATTYIVKNSYKTEHNNVHHVYLRQTMNDLEILNADLNVNIKDNLALSLGHSFYFGPSSSLLGTFSAVQAAAALAAHLHIEVALAQLIVTEEAGDKYIKINGFPGALAPVRARMGYVQVEMGTRLEPVWDLEVDLGDHWYNAHVSASDASVVALYDWVNDLNTYTVYPIGVNDPADGARETVAGPAVYNASPLGWHDQGLGRVFQDTRGNNALCQENWSGNTGTGWLNGQRPKGGSSNDYNFPLSLADAPRVYINASVTNLFYWNNIIHDVFFQYGFTETAGNFQESNFGRGGVENDAVQANAQDGAGYNNANMATPPDGQRPRMRMYVWNPVTPNRDGDLEAGIIIHEYAHGISNRLTGGPSNVNCLNTLEAGGMGEGWGDFFGTALRQRSTYNRFSPFPMGSYSAVNPNGIRKFVYTTNMTVNPETYAYLNQNGYTGVHAKGEVWCGILWEVYWNMVDYYGFNDNWYQGEGGNNQLLRDVVDGMKLQPCNPNFVQARDAILQADLANYNGRNVCRYWAGFAKRGLGVNAVGTGSGRSTVVESFELPSQCK